MSRKNPSTFLPYELKPRTDGQLSFVQALERSVITLCDGPAGTGKTHIPTVFAVNLLRQAAQDSSTEIKKIVITRPIVDAGRSLGYLPGTMEDKIHPYLMPIYDELEYCMDGTFRTQLMKEHVIEICPLHAMRGRNFHRSFIICDEAQNASYRELRLLLTRLGRHSRLCISGDPTQTDLPAAEAGAFMDIAHRLREHDLITHVSLTSEDIVRNKLIADIERLLAR